MTTPDFYFGAGDAPLYTTTLEDANSNAVLVQGAAFTMTMTSVRGGNPITLDLVTNPVVNDDDGTPTNRGKIHRQFTAAETVGLSGLYLVKITGTISGKPITYPNDGFLLFEAGPTAAQGQRRYVGVDELKNTMGAMNTSFLNEDIDVAIESASRYLEDDYNDGKPWTKGSAGEIRYYTRTDDWEVHLGDALKITSVDLDFAVNPYRDRDAKYGPGWGSPLGWGGGSYSTNLPASSYRLLPTTHGLVADGGNGEPFGRLDLARGTTVWRLPSGRDAIRVTGTFGWETVPAGLKMATSLIATRLLKRMRDAPFGIISFGADDRAIAVRQIATDPDIMAAMQPITAVHTKLFA